MMLEMPLGHLDPVHFPLATSFLMARLCARQEGLELRLSGAPDRLRSSLKQRFESSPQVDHRIRTTARSADADSFKNADRLGKDGVKKGTGKGKQSYSAKKRKLEEEEEEEEEGALQDLKPQVDAQGHQSKLSFPPLHAAFHRIRLYPGSRRPLPAMLTDPQEDYRPSQPQAVLAS
eukprot:761405-Hanusia_phi.AAC.4